MKRPIRFRWTAPKRTAIDLLLAGLPKTRVADAVGVSRNTIAAWLKSPEFASAIQARLLEVVNATRLRRMHETQAAADRLARLAHSLLDRAEAAPVDPRTAAAISAWLASWRALREQERLDHGLVELGQWRRGLVL